MCIFDRLKITSRPNKEVSHAEDVDGLSSRPASDVVLLRRRVERGDSVGARYISSLSIERTAGSCALGCALFTDASDRLQFCSYLPTSIHQCVRPLCPL